MRVVRRTVDTYKYLYYAYDKIIVTNYSLACIVHRFATVVTVEKFAVKQLYGDDGEDKMKQYVHD